MELVVGAELEIAAPARMAATMSLAQHGISSIGVFSSGGPIAVSIATATDASEAKTIELNWSVYNAAINELRSTRDGWRMLGFNDIAALRAAGDASLITFR